MIIILAFIIAGCDGSRIITEQDFKSMSAMKGEIVALDVIPWPDDFVPWSGAGPHLKLCIKTETGDMLIVQRICTDINWWRPHTGDAMVGTKGEFPLAFFDKVKLNNSNIGNKAPIKL